MADQSKILWYVLVKVVAKRMRNTPKLQEGLFVTDNVENVNNTIPNQG